MPGALMAHIDVANFLHLFSASLPETAKQLMKLKRDAKMRCENEILNQFTYCKSRKASTIYSASNLYQLFGTENYVSYQI